MPAHKPLAGSPFDKAVRSPLPEDVQQNKIRARSKGWRELEEPGASQIIRSTKSPEIPAAPHLPRISWLTAAALVILGLLLAVAVQHLLLPTGQQAWRLSSSESSEEGLMKDLSFCGKLCTADDVLDVAKHRLRRLEKEKAAVMQRLQQFNATAAKLHPVEGELKSCIQQIQQQNAQLQEIGVLKDRLAGCKHDTERLSKERQDLQQQLYDSRAASADSTLVLAKLKEVEVEAEDLRAKLSQVTEGQQEATKKVKDGEAREQALRVELQDREKLLKALGGGVEECSDMLDKSEASVRRFKMRVGAVSACLASLAASAVWAYKQWVGRKIWRLHSDLLKLQSRLAVAQTGVPQRVRSRNLEERSPLRRRRA